MTKRFFVTGTDTDVGKTFVTCAMLRHFNQQNHKVLGFKPISAGCEVGMDSEVNSEVDSEVANDSNTGEKVLVNEDAALIQAHSNVQAPLSVINPIAFEPPIAPHIAASQVGQRIDFTRLDNGWHELQQINADVYLVEGAGGWCLPLNEVDTLNQWVEQQQFAVIVVVGIKLGCLNHALLTAQAIESQGLKIAGWVANIINPETAFIGQNIEHLKTAINAPMLARIPYFTDVDNIDFDQIAAEFEPLL